MEIVVNHLTRMTGMHICVAGLDLETCDHIRPVLEGGDRISADQLRVNGGPFAVGHVVELGEVRNVGDPPEVEDRLMEPGRAAHVRRLRPDEFWELLTRFADSRLERLFGDDLAFDGPGLTIPVGSGPASLGCLRPLSAPRLYVSDDGRVRVVLQHGLSDVNLSLTDVRFHESDLRTPDREAVAGVANRIRDGVGVVLSMGLGRAYPREEPRHWLQVNSVHLEDDPLGLQIG